MTAILIIDDDRALCRSLQIQLAAHGHDVAFENRAADGIEAARDGDAELVLLDLGLPDATGLDVLRAFADEGIDVPVVMVTGQQDTKATIEAMRLGAFDYVRKPFALDDVLLVLEKLERQRRLATPGPDALVIDTPPAPPGEIVGRDRRIVEVVKQIGLLSRSPVTVLIEGETGTGKELVAHALHEASAPGKPFVAVNCSAIVPTLMESELFGHERGAFTGADRTRAGRFEQAGSGTLFLDEISEISLELQAKLLRVLQERTFERVGGDATLALDARVIAATNRDAAALVREGRFREDLYYRLGVTRIELPALRERRDDLPLLVAHLVERLGRTLHRRIGSVSDEAMRRLAAYDWPGNVRELENVLTRAIAIAPGDALTEEELAVPLADPDRPSTDEGVVPLRETERRAVRRALDANEWNVTRTAKQLEISPTTLRKKIADYGLEP